MVMPSDLYWPFWPALPDLTRRPTKEVQPPQAITKSPRDEDFARVLDQAWCLPNLAM